MILPHTNFVNIRERTMNEKSIKKLCILMSFLGLIIIYMMEVTSTVPYTKVSEITSGDVGECVKVCGIVNKKYVTDKGHIFFNLKDNSSIKVVIFKNENSLITPEDIKDSSTLCLEGTVARYKGELEIIADRLLTDSRE